MSELLFLCIKMIKIMHDHDHQSDYAGAHEYTEHGTGLKLKLSLNTGRAFTLHHRRRNMLQMLRFSSINITFFLVKNVTFL